MRDLPPGKNQTAPPVWIQTGRGCAVTSAQSFLTSCRVSTIAATALPDHRLRYNVAPQKAFIITAEYERRKLKAARWRVVTQSFRVEGLAQFERLE